MSDSTPETQDTLPAWDLTDLYPAMDSPEVAADLRQAQAEAEALATDVRGQLGSLTAEALAAAIGRYEAVQEVLGRLMSYAYLVYATDMSASENGRFYQTMQENVTGISGTLVFFTLELNSLDDGHVAQVVSEDATLRHYATWLTRLRAHKPYQLSDELERLLLDKEVSGRSAWVRLFDETCATLTFPVGDRQLGLEETLHLMSSAQQTQRKQAGQALAQVFQDNNRVFTHILNTVVKDKDIEDQRRGYPDVATGRHISNAVEAPVVEALTQAVRESYPDLSHRYYQLKAGWLGQDKLAYWDRNAPLPDDDDRTFTWDQAVSTVLSAYGQFAPWLADVGQQFFDQPWIDAAPRPGKAPGAFAHPVVPSAHPYLLVNYLGKTRDVMTLAHELGHGVHQMLARGQGALQADTPLTLAETASVFGEQLTFRALLRGAETTEARRALLASKVEDMLNTVVRQTAFYEFERAVHLARQNGELPAEDIGRIWMETQQTSLGPVFDFAPEYQYFWCYISHFIHAPFYVYAYAFGDCLVNALYAVYEEKPDGFAEKYRALLTAGGSRTHGELLAPFGLDASDPVFWHKGLGVIRGFIDELELMTGKA